MADEADQISDDFWLEFLLLHYVPCITVHEEVCIAVAIFDSDLHNVCHLFIAKEWEAKVLRLDSDADLFMLRAILSEVGNKLHSAAERQEMLRELEFSFSNAIRVSSRKSVKLQSGDTLEGFASSLLQGLHPGSRSS